MSIVIQVVWLALIATIEIVATQWDRLVRGHARKVRNLAFTVINHLVIPAATVTVTHLCQPRIGTHWIAGLPALPGIVLTVVALDFAGYWFHRFSHRNLFLWRFHQIHHLDEDFDATTGARVHTAEEVMHQVVLVVIAVMLGVPSSYFTVFATLSFIMAIFHHCNVAIAWKVERVLRTIVFTPALHVPHHNDDIVNTDSNFGFIFPWWDRMFGTYNTAQRTPQWRIGLDYSHDLSLHRLIVQPFVPKQLKESAIAPAPYATYETAGQAAARPEGKAA
ncbi:sterol desaturase family protein [Streptomyces sp. NPDC020883]|uniref:sterol desaturase family protein n=1 Tax=Streptomyces sp. NPDC020883 TaxID=3365099 RepID=UPI00378DBA26